MKVLHVTKKYPHALGGDAVVVANLQKQQQAAGHRVVIVTSNCDAIKTGEHIYKIGLKDTPSGLDNITIRRIISLIMLFFQMFFVLYKERPNVIHTHSVDMTFFVSFAARWYRIPLIHTFHIVTFYDKSQPALRRKSELWLVRKSEARHITAPNAYDVKKLQMAGLSQAVLLSNGVDLALWKSHGYTEKNKIVTFVAVGRLETQKGYEYLIEAVALLAKTWPLHVIIIGNGSQKAILEKLTQKLGVEKFVTLAGQKTPREIRTILTEAHAAVFPSLYETTPLTLLEAWAASIPAIATPVGILRDAPSNFKAASIIPAKDPHALADAMEQFIKNEQLRKTTAESGYAEVKKYTWSTVARSLEAIYRSER